MFIRVLQKVAERMYSVKYLVGAGVQTCDISAVIHRCATIRFVLE